MLLRVSFHRAFNLPLTPGRGLIPGHAAWRTGRLCPSHNCLKLASEIGMCRRLIAP